MEKVVVIQQEDTGERNDKREKRENETLVRMKSTELGEKEEKVKVELVVQPRGKERTSVLVLVYRK